MVIVINNKIMRHK